MEQQDKPSDMQEVIFCSKCGNQGTVESRFCSKCGAQLAGSQVSSFEVSETVRTLIRSINKNIDKVAIASVVIAAIGLLIGGGIYAGLGAIGLGIYAKRLIEKGRGTRRKLAITGIWLGVAVSVVAVYYTGAADGYAIGIQAGMEAGKSAGIEAGKQQMVDGILNAIGSIFF